MGGLYNGADDPQKAQLELMAGHDLHVTTWRAGELLEMDPARRDELAGLAEQFGVRIGLGIGLNPFVDDPDEIERAQQRALEAVRTLAPMFRSPVCTGGLRHDSFTRDPAVEEQICRASEAWAPVAEAAAEAGCPVGLHNAGHYCSDLAELCRRTPGLGILFDTANPWLAGERPVRAARDAAPHAVGTHFKDHYVWPNKKARPLCLEMRGALIGSGDAGIAEIYRILAAEAPRPGRMAMMMEIDPVEGMQQHEALAACCEYVKSL